MENVNKKIRAAREFPTHPYNFSNGASLNVNVSTVPVARMLHICSQTSLVAAIELDSDEFQSLSEKNTDQRLYEEINYKLKRFYRSADQCNDSKTN